MLRVRSASGLFPRLSFALKANAYSTQAAATGAATESHTAEKEKQYVGPPKIVIFGGRGFVGSAVCKEALNTGLKVVSISPSGTPPVSRASWTSEVDWVRGNALEPVAYQNQLDGAVAVISCVGGFGNQQQMLKVNGAANVTLIEAAKAAGVPRFVFISATIPNIPGIDFALSGYVQGKAQAESALARCYPGTGVALRPGVIYGTRYVSSSLSLPLGAVFQPLEYLLNQVPNVKQLAGLPLVGAAFTPPVSVEAVARAAVRAATDPAVTGPVMDLWEIASYK